MQRIPWHVRDGFRIILKSLKSHHPRNVTTYFSQFILINVTLEIPPHGTGSITIHVGAHASYVLKKLISVQVHFYTVVDKDKDK